MRLDNKPQSRTVHIELSSLRRLDLNDDLPSAQPIKLADGRYFTLVTVSSRHSAARFDAPISSGVTATCAPQVRDRRLASLSSKPMSDGIFSLHAEDVTRLVASAALIVATCTVLLAAFTSSSKRSSHYESTVVISVHETEPHERRTYGDVLIEHFAHTASTHPCQRHVRRGIGVARRDGVEKPLASIRELLLDVIPCCK